MMNIISLDYLSNNALFYDSENKKFILLDAFHNTTIWTKNDVDIDYQVNLYNCWAYTTKRKRKSDNSKSLFDCDYFLCPKLNDQPNNEPLTIYLNKIKQKQSVLLIFKGNNHSSIGKKHVRQITTMVVHPFNYYLYTGCNDGSIIHWSFGTKQTTKLVYTCQSRIIAMDINSQTDMLLLIEEKSTSINIFKIGKTLQNIHQLKQDINLASISNILLKSVGNSLITVAGNKSFITLFKLDSNCSSEINEKNTFSKFQNIVMKKKISSYDIVDHNNLYYVAILNREKSSILIFLFQKLYTIMNEENIDHKPLFILNVMSPNNQYPIHIFNMKLISHSGLKGSPICCIYYSYVEQQNSDINMNISMIYLDDLKFGTSEVFVNKNTEINTIKSIMDEANSFIYSNNLENNSNNHAINVYGDKPLPTTQTLVQALTQAICSNDTRLLDDIIRRTSSVVIDNSVKLLPSHLAYRLLSTLTKKVESNPSKSSELVYWLKSIICHHAVFFSNTLCDSSNDNAICQLENILKYRSNFYEQLCDIQGRLSLLMNHIKKQYDNNYDNMENKIINPAIMIDENNLEETLTERLVDFDHHSDSSLNNEDCLNMDDSISTENESDAIHSSLE